MRNNSELIVITKAKDLVNYVFAISENSPKKFRFTLISHMQNASLEVMKNLILANEIMIGKSDVEDYCRLRLQRETIANLKVLDALAMTAREQQCILSKQHTVLSKYISDSINLTGAWINSDKKRYRA